MGGRPAPRVGRCLQVAFVLSSVACRDWSFVSSVREECQSTKRIELGPRNADRDCCLAFFVLTGMLDSSRQATFLSAEICFLLTLSCLPSAPTSHLHSPDSSHRLSGQEFADADSLAQLQEPLNADLPMSAYGETARMLSLVKVNDLTCPT